MRALEIIRGLEPVKRNVYSGAVGYLGWHGDADMAIAIRTAVIQGGRLHVQAGAGIVHDSDPVKEWEETMSKGRALFRAVAHRSEEHTSELQSLMRISYAVFCLQKKKPDTQHAQQ